MGRIGVFDSGYGGLTILEAIRNELPTHDYIYLGDNARTPYGSRSFEVVYEYTLQAVNRLFDMGCELVIVACNTASAKALRSIQQNDLVKRNDNKRVLGVIRPTTEIIGNYTNTKHIGILGTEGTVRSNSYAIEVAKFFPELNVSQHYCPMWVPLVENNVYATEGGEFFIKKDIDAIMSMHSDIDTIVLACTHYPLMIEQIRKFTPDHVKVISQGPIVAKSLSDYLERHPDMDARLGKGSSCVYYTTENPNSFDRNAHHFVAGKVISEHLHL